MRGGAAGPHLLVLAGSEEGARLLLAPEQTLGRGVASDLRVRDPLTSRVHARIRVAGGAAEVEDLGSKNGVRVNGRRVGRGPRALRSGDRIALGGSLLAYADPLADPAPCPPVPGADEAPGARGPMPRLRVAAALLLAAAAALALAGRS